MDKWLEEQGRHDMIKNRITLPKITLEFPSTAAIPSMVQAQLETDTGAYVSCPWAVVKEKMDFCTLE